MLQAIRNGRLAPGQRLIEGELTAALGVSRGPIREAMSRLAAEGIVRINRHRGAYVNALSRAEAFDTFVVIEVLTRLMARLAAEAVAKGARSPALRQLETFREGGSAELASNEGRAGFYDALLELGGNRQLQRIRPAQQVQLIRRQMQPYLNEHDRAEQIAEYARITSAVLAGDPAGAEQAMDDHLRKARERFDRTPDEAFALHRSEET